MALASRKLLTTTSGLQPTCGGRTTRPQQAPAPAGGAGAEADCGPLPDGMTEQPPTTTAATTTSTVTSPVRPPGRWMRARPGSGIGAPPPGAARAVLARGDDPPEPPAGPGPRSFVTGPWALTRGA